jgi:hypothetical protein
VARRHPRAEDEEIHAPGSIEALSNAIEYQLTRDLPVALGLETPLFVPVPDKFALLGKQRPCDAGGPAWSSRVGASVMATGIVQAAWLLRRLRECCPEAAVHFGWKSFAASQSGLLLWEAFVTGEANGTSHGALQRTADRVHVWPRPVDLPAARPIGRGAVERGRYCWAAGSRRSTG